MKRKSKIRAWGSALVLALGLCFILVLCTPNMHRCDRRGANRRACFANQKTIAGAIEMYELDYDVQVEQIDRKRLEVLVDNGYLQSVPLDPGHGSIEEGPTGTSYFLGSDGVSCSRHGSCQNPKAIEEATRPLFTHHRSPILTFQLLGGLLIMQSLLAIWRLSRHFSSYRGCLAVELFCFFLPFPFGAVACGLFVCQLVLELLIVFWRFISTTSLELELFGTAELPTTAWEGTKGALRRKALHEDRRLLQEKALLYGLAAAPFLLISLLERGAFAELIRHADLIGFLLLMGVVTGLAQGVKGLDGHRRSDGALVPLEAVSAGSVIVGACSIHILLEGLAGAWPSLSLVTPGLFAGLHTALALRHGLGAICLRRYGKEIEGRMSRTLTKRPATPVCRPLLTLALPPMELRLREAHCPVCGEDFHGTAVALCMDCGTPHHPSCLEWNGRCATFGCGATEARRISPRARAIAQA